MALLIDYDPNKTIEQIAEENGISVHTVREYIKANGISRQADNHNIRVEAVKAAIEKYPNANVSELSRIVGLSRRTIEKYQKAKEVKEPITILSLNDGIGTRLSALKQLKVKVKKYYAYDYSPIARDICIRNHKRVINLDNIEQWKRWDIDFQTIDLVIGNPFTYTYYEILKYLKILNPNVKFLFYQEQIDNVDKIDSLLGVEGFYSNQWPTRQTIFWTNIALSNLYSPSIILSDVIEEANNKDRQLYISQEDFNDLKEEMDADIEVDYPQLLQVPSIYAPLVLFREGEFDDGYSNYRRLSPSEIERLLGLPQGYSLYYENHEIVPNSERYMVLRKEWAFPTIKQILANL